MLFQKRFVYLEAPKAWVEKGPDGLKQTDGALAFMKELQKNSKERFRDKSIPAKENFALPDHEVKSGKSVSTILRDNIESFKNDKDLLILALTHMNVTKEVDIHVLRTGEKIKVENGEMIISGLDGQERLRVELLPWTEVETSDAIIPEPVTPEPQSAAADQPTEPANVPAADIEIPVQNNQTSDQAQVTPPVAEIQQANTQ
ncbi:MAG: hypothetical protein ACD_63C00037G0002 [uncultured bacterium]|nr:MAG: hypothetical protein ACD_63C00037G0002 [uncultured bacterium]